MLYLYYIININIYMYAAICTWVLENGEAKKGKEKKGKGKKC